MRRDFGDLRNSLKINTLQMHSYFTCLVIFTLAMKIVSKFKCKEEKKQPRGFTMTTVFENFQDSIAFGQLIMQFLGETTIIVVFYVECLYL